MKRTPWIKKEMHIAFMIKEVPFIDNVFSLTVTPSNQQIKNVKAVIERNVKGCKIDFAIIGEPTLLNISIAERGLMVLDCKSIGKSG